MTFKQGTVGIKSLVMCADVGYWNGECLIGRNRTGARRPRLISMAAGQHWHDIDVHQVL